MAAAWAESGGWKDARLVDTMVGAKRCKLLKIRDECEDLPVVVLTGGRRQYSAEAVKCQVAAASRGGEMPGGSRRG